MPAFVVHGDSFLVRQRMAALEAEHGADALLDANRHRMQGNQVSSQELLGVCQALPFLDALRLVSVEGLLATAESRSGGGRGRRGAGTTDDRWQPLVDAIPGMPDTTLLLLSDGALNGNNPLLRALAPVCSVDEQTAPRGEPLLRWIKESAESKGAAISPPAIRSMADLVGSDLWTLNQELEKLSLYASGREIGEADIRLMVSQVREASIFEAVDAMIDGRTQVALRLLAQLRDDGREPQYIIAMVERQLRLLALAHDSVERRVPQNELKRTLGTSSDFVVRKTMEQARRYSREDIAWRYDRLLEADLSIKQGRVDPDLALEPISRRRCPAPLGGGCLPRFLRYHRVVAGHVVALLPLRQRGMWLVPALVGGLETARQEGALLSLVYQVRRVAWHGLYRALHVVQPGQRLQQRPGVGVLGPAEQRYHVGVLHHVAAVDDAHPLGHRRHYAPCRG